jgi:cell division protein FtsX
MKRTLLMIGAIAGCLFSVWDSMVSYADTAPLNNEIGIEIISWPFFILKTMIYLVIGGVTGWLISFIIHRFNRKTG